MAKSQLTERQREIKTLLDRGKTPGEVGDALGISENAVYQARRRINGASGKRGTRRSTTASRPSARKSTRRSRSSTRRPPAPAPAPAPTAAPARLTPLQAIRTRKAEIEATLKDRQVAVDEAARTLEKAQAALSEGQSKVAEEITRLQAAEAALSGAKPKATQRKRSAKTTPAAPATATATQEAPAAPQNGSEATPEAPAATTTPAAPAPVSEERPGVETVPEFAAEDDGETVEPPTGDEAAALVGAEGGEFEQGGDDPFSE